MADFLGKLHLIPYTPGIKTFGKGRKTPRGLSVCEDWEYELDGTLKRRGGQVRLNQVPVRQGLASIDFLDDEITVPWTFVNTNNTFLNFLHPSVVRVFGPSGAVLSAGAIEFENVDGNGDEIFPILVETLSTDQATAATQTLVSRTVVRARFETLPAIGSGYFRVSVDPGRPSGSAEWSLVISWNSDGIRVQVPAATHDEISGIAGVTDHLGSNDSSDYIDSEWHTWRMDVTLTGSDYFLALYLDEVLIYSGAEILDTSSDPSSSTPKSALLFQSNSGAAIFDVEVDSFDAHTTDEPIRSLARFEVPEELVSPPQRAAFYAGTRAYVDHGDSHSFQVIDDDILPERQVDFVVFRGKLIYASTANIVTKPKRFKIGDRQAEEIVQAPPVSILQVHKRRLWGAGDNNFPSRLYFSEEANEELWNPLDGGGFIDVEPDDGQKITGIGPSFQGDLIVYKQRGIFRIQGSGPSSFALVSIHQGPIGAAAHQTIRNVGNDQYFVSKIGIHSLLTTDRFGDLERTFLSTDIRDIWDEFVNPEMLHLAWATYNEPFDRYEVLLPTFQGATDGMTLNRIFSLHWSLRSEDFPVGSWSIKKITGSCVATLTRAGMERDRMVVGTNDGFLAMQDQPNPIDFPTYSAT